jgi:transposase InsO family protein
VGERRQIVMAQKGAFSQTLLCAVIGLPRSSLYYRAQPADDLALRSALEAVALEYPRYGYRRITAELQRQGWRVNHKHVLRLMREENLLVQVQRFCRTTFSQHPYGRYPNLVQQLAIVRPDQVWCGDITYIRLRREFIYLAVLMDIFTRSIRGWVLGRDLTEELPKAALRRALDSHRPEIHHSDQGVQYAAHGYIGLLEAAGVQVSMAAQGQPTQNAYAERLMHTSKDEEVYLHEYLDFAEACQHIGHFLDDVYMHKRLHSALGYVPPAEFEATWRAAQQPPQACAVDMWTALQPAHISTAPTTADCATLVTNGIS